MTRPDTREDILSLAACPFCGRNTGSLQYDDVCHWRQVVCGGCGAKAAEYPGDDTVAIAAWNRRAAPTPPAAEAPGQEPVQVKARIDDLIERLLDAQQDINLAANQHMDQSLCDASALIDEVEKVLRSLSAPTKQEPVADTLRSVIARLESACELLASTRPQAAYIAMIDGGQADALLALDEARQEARTVLSAPPTYADAEATKEMIQAGLDDLGWGKLGDAALDASQEQAVASVFTAMRAASLASPAPKEPGQ